MTPSTLTRPQNMVALDLANAVVREREALKREMGDGTVSFVEALDDPRAQPMTLYKLVLARPRWGRVRARKFIRDLGLTEHRRVRDLTARQRAAVLAEAS